MATYEDRCVQSWRRLQDAKPLVQCITNFVSMDIMANCLNAIGASPAMVRIHVYKLRRGRDSCSSDSGINAGAWRGRGGGVRAYSKRTGTQCGDVVERLGQVDVSRCKGSGFSKEAMGSRPRRSRRNKLQNEGIVRHLLSATRSERTFVTFKQIKGSIDNCSD